MKEIITYDIFIDEDEELGVDKISLVKKPAIMENFIFMNEAIDQIYREISLSDEKRIITGPVLIPDQEIIRKDDDGNPYYIKYSAAEIEKIVQKFFKLKDQYSVNKDHKTDVSDVYIYESWIVGENDKSRGLGMGLPVGTWVVSMKVDDNEIWENIKSGKYKGFSIEGLFRFKRNSKLVKQERFLKRNLKSSNVDRVLYDDELKQLYVKFKEGDTYTYFEVDYDTFQSIVTGLGGTCKTEGENKFGSWFEGKTPSIGASVWDQLINKEVTYSKGGSTLLEVEDKISDDIELSIDDMEEKNKVINMISAILKDGQTMKTDAEAFAVGVEVYFMNGEEKVKVDAGEYELEDGNIYVVDEASMISEIKEVAVDVEETSVETKPEEVKTELTMETIAAYFEPILQSIVTLLEELKGGNAVQQSKIETIETKLEKVIVEKEMKSVETIDDKKNVELSRKSKFDYDVVTKLNKKF
jgi:hypothetical protein